MRRRGKDTSALSAVRTQQEGDRLQGWKGAYPTPQPWWHPDLRLSAPKTVRKKSLLLKPPRYCIGYSSPSWLRQEVTHAEDLRFKACQRQRGSRSQNRTCSTAFTGPTWTWRGAVGSTRGRGGPCLLGAEGQGWMTNGVSQRAGARLTGRGGFVGWLITMISEDAWRGCRGWDGPDILGAITSRPLSILA